MSDASLIPMKMVEIIMSGEDLHLVEKLLVKAGASGFTIVPNVSGRGHHGSHEGHLLFNDMHTLDMLFSIVPEDLVEPILAGLGALFERHSGMVFVSDVWVTRQRYFKQYANHAL
ncbi:MAG: P-II family nitrogen regulator [Deltaproteobacteria bacterium]|nr:MAG: P-II family nitrogen regulator [Deltaproteobacteria bacterium]